MFGGAEWTERTFGSEKAVLYGVMAAAMAGALLGVFLFAENLRDLDALGTVVVRAIGAAVIGVPLFFLLRPHAPSSR